MRTPGGDKFIGRIYFNDEGLKEKARDEAARQGVAQAIKEGEPIRLSPAFEFTKTQMPVQTPEGIAFNQITQCAPLDNAVTPSTLYTIITSAHLFLDMEASSRDRHKGLVKEVLAQLLKVRANALGLHLPEKGGAPHGHRRS